MQAFVVMPIRKDGTPEHAHFRAIYDDYIRPELEKFGFQSVRADEVQKSGAITRDIVTRLADADLVVADLTDLNPNVFYELGIRHALRGRGTVMLIDEDRTRDLPFDLASYRVHKYGTSSISAISPLRRALNGFLTQLVSDTDAESVTENPVHDWLPALPLDVLGAASKSTEGDLRKQVAEARAKARAYELKYGLIDESSPIDSGEERIRELLEKAREGRLGADLVRAALAATTRQDRVGYLEAVAQLLSDPAVVLDTTDYLRILQAADVLGIAEAKRPLIDAATMAHPNHDGLNRLRLGFLAHSHLKSDREAARSELFRQMGIRVEADGGVSLAETFSLVREYGIMMDTLHADKLNAMALSIASRVAAKSPTSELAVRCYARALEECGQLSIDWYRKAALLPAATDTGAQWLGNTLHNERRLRDAIEAFALACVRDPSDSSLWAQLAAELCTYMSEGEPGMDSGWTLSMIPVLVEASVRCNVTQGDLDTMSRALAKVGLDSLITEIARGDGEYAHPEGVPEDLVLVSGRRALARLVYEKFATRLTDPDDPILLALEPTDYEAEASQE